MEKTISNISRTNLHKEREQVSGNKYQEKAGKVKLEQSTLMDFLPYPVFKNFHLFHSESL